MKISLCITTWNRTDLVIKSFEKVHNDPRVDEIIIVDDASEDYLYKSLRNLISSSGYHKVELHRNEKNLDCYRNKRQAVGYANNQQVILLDSDNVIDVDYLNALESYPARFSNNEKTILAPTLAKPHFDYRELNFISLTHWSAAYILKKYKCFPAAINTANYFFYKDEWIRVWDKYDDGTDPHTADTMFVNYNWIKEGNSIFFLPGLEYQHLIHSGSHYQNNVKKTGTFADELLKKFEEL